MHSQKSKYFLLVFIILIFAVGSASGQDRGKKTDSGKFAVKHKRTEIVLDSIAIARKDSLARADSLWRTDSLAMMSESSLEQPAFSEAVDSIREDFSNGQKKIYYYGDVSVTYMNMKLTASYMEYDMNTGTVYAKGVYDTLTKETVGKPVMTEGKNKYYMEEVYYNFNTRKARITNMLTKDNENIIHGKNIKMMPDKSINMTKGKYTVCDLEDPHYYLDLSLAKVMSEPTKKTIFGPAHMVLGGVHLPFVALPFGFVPERPQRATGILFPTFGEEAARGFYFKDAGLYFVFGDHFDIAVTGDFYTLGSWAVNVNSRYKVNYKFDGNFSLTYSVNREGEKGGEDFIESTDFKIAWNHRQDSKAHPGANFSASVNFSTPKSNRYNSRSVNEALENRIQSSISYSRNWNGKMSFSLNALHNQNTKDSSYSFTLPNISFSVNTFYPFKRKIASGSEKFYEKISFGYSTSVQNRINFYAKEFKQPGFWDKFQNGMNHNFNIGLPSFQLFKYITFAPSVSYGMNWYFRKTEYTYNEETQSLEKKTGSPFSSFGVTQNYSFSMSSSTRLYGMFNFSPRSKVKAIRHVITPSLSASFSPNLKTYANGWRTLEYHDITTGTDKKHEYNIYEGQINSAPSSGKSGSLGLQIGNTLEAKVKNRQDTTGVGTKIVKLIESFNISTSYNFLADSMRLSNISMSLGTKLFNQVSINASMNLDPYSISLATGRRCNRFAVAAGQGLARITSAHISLSYGLNGEGTINGNNGSKSTSSTYYDKVYYHPVTGEYIPSGWLYYTNPNSPWNINFSGDFSYNPTYTVEEGVLVKNKTFSATLGINGNIKLTPRLKITMTSGYDFIGKSITTSQLTATYDLHCFNISVQWVPIGMYKSYSFRLAANAAALADLLRFRKSKSYLDY